MILADEDFTLLKRFKDAIEDSGFELTNIEFDEFHLGNREYRDEIVVKLMRKVSE